ncbi:hypothetical protein [Bradyrhizobium sp. MOS002]|uniref:hypothetical protein n=1 Tax=Bradyrhizobium sp. MOS002 TaxID=2133947 RepID=UPI000D123DBE|nr:hypothetical protein [Bradyrhizobium sp. MOS002]PSO30120.1 hypothetical protein C7G41_22745 [Bradyrhizobium sp. MOS002]
MTTNRPLQMSPDAAERMLDRMEAEADKWVALGFCPCCVARTLLLHAGLIAAHELAPGDMRAALGYIAKQSERHAPAPDGKARH